MNQMEKMRRKIKGKKGFTLMEMLIVVAIIVALLAIAIPAFNSALKKAKVAADEANVRSYYAEILINNMDAAADKLVLPNEGKDGIDITGKMGQAGYPIQVKGATVIANGGSLENFTLTYTYDKSAPSFKVGGTGSNTQGGAGSNTQGGAGSNTQGG